MKLLIGCPVTNRAWIIPQWFEAVDTALDGSTASFVFVVGNSEDDTSRVIESQMGGRDGYVCWVAEPAHEGAARTWNEDRYAHMAKVRNVLLRSVRGLKPDYFLSLDSDILLHPDAIKSLMDSIKDFDAVAGKVYLQPPPQTKAVNCARLSRSQGLSRSDADGVKKVQIIMAMKLMTPDAYHVDYQAHFQGEDVGWSLACAEAGLQLGWDGRIASKHVMRPDLLDVVDKRVGF